MDVEEWGALVRLKNDIQQELIGDGADSLELADLTYQINDAMKKLESRPHFFANNHPGSGSEFLPTEGLLHERNTFITTVES